MSENFPPPPFHIDKLTNKLVIELYNNSKAHYRAGSQRILHRWICDILKEDVNNINSSSLLSRVKSVCMKFRKLKTCRKFSELAVFENLYFKIPDRFFKNKPKLANRAVTFNHQLIALKKKVHMYSLDLTKHKKMLKRRDTKISLLKKELEFWKQKQLSKPKVGTTSVQTDFIKSERISLSSRSTQCNFQRQEIVNATEEIKYWQDQALQKDENNNLHLNENVRERHIRGNPYSDQIRESVFSCLSWNVPLENISSVIHDIVKIFTDMDLQKLPSVGTIHNMAGEAASLSRFQINEAIAETDNIAMLRDATTKKGHHFYGVKINTNEQEYTLGIKEISCGTAEKYTETTIGLLKSVENQDQPPVITKVASCMTDRSATELKTNKLLKEIKNKTISEIFDILEEDPATFKDIHEFQCCVHPLLQFAEEAEKVAKDIEKSSNINFEYLIRSKGESYTHNLLRCISKLFYDDKSGDPLMSSHFLLQKGIKKVPVMKFKGNRFNTFFFNAAGTFCIRNFVMEYLRTSKSSLNLLHSGILQLYENKTVLSICNAFGLICKKITTPYFTLSSRLKTALEMEPVYNCLVKGLQNLEKKPSIILDEKFFIFQDEMLKDEPDEFYKPLYTNELVDNSVVLLSVQKLVSLLIQKCTKFFSDFLPGGKFCSLDEKLRIEAKQCPSNNISLERLMAQLDRQKVIAPNSTLPTLNSKIMFRNNNTYDWLRSKDNNEKHHLLKKARLQNQIDKEKNIDEDIKLIEERSKIIEKRIEEKHQKEMKIDENTRKIVEEVNKAGGKWKTLSQMEIFLQNCTYKKDKLNAVKNQIIYRKDVEKQIVSDRDLFRKTGNFDLLQSNLIQLINFENSYITLENAKTSRDFTTNNNRTSSSSNSSTTYSSPTLSTNASTMVTPTVTTPTTVSSLTLPVENNSSMKYKDMSPTALKGKQIIHKWEEDGIVTSYNGRITNYLSKNKTFRVKNNPKISPAQALFEGSHSFVHKDK